MSTQISLEQQWEDFFQSGFYKQGWKIKIDPQRTQEEVAGVLKLLNPSPGAHILDWCGGWGRHAIEFAMRGYQVTLLDFAANHIQAAEQAARQAGVELELIHSDFRNTPASIQADLAVNLFTAGIGYLTEEDDLQALQSLHAALKPGAKFLLDTMNLFWIVKHYQTKGWEGTEDGKFRVFRQSEFDFLTNRNRAQTTLLVKGQPEREQVLDHRIYSAAELAAVLKKAGFDPFLLYGGFDGQPFTFDSKRIVMISQRR